MKLSVFDSAKKLVKKAEVAYAEELAEEVAAQKQANKKKGWFRR